jgi:hypothetical protein
MTFRHNMLSLNNYIILEICCSDWLLVGIGSLIISGGYSERFNAGKSISYLYITLQRVKNHFDNFHSKLLHEITHDLGIMWDPVKYCGAKMVAYYFLQLWCNGVVCLSQFSQVHCLLQYKSPNIFKSYAIMSPPQSHIMGNGMGN